MFMYERGDIEGQKILLWETMTFSLALLATGFPRSVTVLEVDSRLVDFIGKRKKILNLKFTNTMLPILPFERPRLFCFVTDPVEEKV